jgi:hypothetical protein
MVAGRLSPHALDGVKQLIMDAELHIAQEIP